MDKNPQPPGLDAVMRLLQQEFRQLQQGLRQDFRNEVRECLAAEIRPGRMQLRAAGISPPRPLGACNDVVPGSVSCDSAQDDLDLITSGLRSCEMIDAPQYADEQAGPSLRKIHAEPTESDQPSTMRRQGSGAAASSCQKPLLERQASHSVPMSAQAKEYARIFDESAKSKRTAFGMVDRNPHPKHEAKPEPPVPNSFHAPPSTPPNMPMTPVRDALLQTESSRLTPTSVGNSAGRLLRATAEVVSSPLRNPHAVIVDDELTPEQRKAGGSPKSSDLSTPQAWSTPSPLKKRGSVTNLTISDESPEHSPSKSLANKLAKKGSNESPQNMERAMGLTRARVSADFDHASSLRKCVSKIVYSPYFDCASLAFIFINAIIIGFQTNYSAENLDSQDPMSYRTVEILFCFIFTVEVVMRIIVHGIQFFNGWGWAWNMLDFTLIVIQFFGEMLRALGEVDSIFQSASVLRGVRLCRSLRILRTLHITRVSSDLRMLLSCLMHSLSTFFWAITMLFLLTYIMGILLTDVTLGTRSKLDESTQSFKDLTAWYGSVPRTLLSLFQAFSGGVDWNDLSAPLMNVVSPWWGMCFLLYIAFIFFAVNNLVTAIFVETAIERAEVEKEKHKMGQAWRLFQSLDFDSSGTITREEMREHLTEPAVVEYFKSIDLDVSELDTLFRILDMDGSGQVDFQEFMNGCLRLQGSAKALDVLLIMQEMRLSFKQLTDSLSHVETIVESNRRNLVSTNRSLSNSPNKNGAGWR